MPLSTMILAFATAFTMGASFVLLILVHMYRMGVLRGQPGEPGPPGCMGALGEPASIIRLRGVLPYTSELPVLTAQHGEAYIVHGRYFVFLENIGSFVDAGPITQG